MRGLTAEEKACGSCTPALIIKIMRDAKLGRELKNGSKRGAKRIRQLRSERCKSYSGEVRRYKAQETKKQDRRIKEESLSP